MNSDLDTWAPKPAAILKFLAQHQHHATEEQIRQHLTDQDLKPRARFRDDARSLKAEGLIEKVQDHWWLTAHGDRVARLFTMPEQAVQVLLPDADAIQNAALASEPNLGIDIGQDAEHVFALHRKPFGIAVEADASVKPGTAELRNPDGSVEAVLNINGMPHVVETKSREISIGGRMVGKQAVLGQDPTEVEARNVYQAPDVQLTKEQCEKVRRIRSTPKDLVLNDEERAAVEDFNSAMSRGVQQWQGGIMARGREGQLDVRPRHSSPLAAMFSGARI